MTTIIRSINAEKLKTRAFQLMPLTLNSGQIEMAQLWQKKISDRTISRGLKKLGLLVKKTYGYQKRDEVKR
ncbi:MAG TPA: hypothetical protein DEP38_07160 [Cyanobacteria bacterium UBA9226]|nr:hypothetical protein [Cyanobacteria bacterium UBA11166]HCA94438.1 hypothetical protein [Cyanobacteria bacterium UBA9226]